MLLDEIESENGYHAFDTKSTYSSVSSASTKSKDRTWLPRNFHPSGKQSYQLSSVHIRHIFNPFKSRSSSDETITEEKKARIYMLKKSSLFHSLSGFVSFRILNNLNSSVKNDEMILFSKFTSNEFHRKVQHFRFDITHKTQLERNNSSSSSL